MLGMYLGLEEVCPRFSFWICLSCEVVNTASFIIYSEVLFSYAVGSDLGPSLREICAANRSDEKQV